MTKTKWYEGLSEKEIENLKDGADMRAGYPRAGDTPEDTKKRKAEILDKLIEEKYNKYLEEIERIARMAQENKERVIKEEEQRQKNLEKGIATLELYESNKYRCWAAEVTGLDSKFGFNRNFINPIEYKGNYRIYRLKEGKIYNYLNNNKQSFVKVEDARLIEMTREEVEDYFNEH